MSQQLVVRPHAYRQFAAPAQTFCLVTDPGLAGDVVFEGEHAYAKTITVPLAAGESFADLFSGGVPESADVLVVCRGSFVTSPDEEVIGEGRRIVVMPCASTPVTASQVRYFLEVMEHTDPDAQVQRADRFFQAIEQAGTVLLVDGEQSSRVEFDPFGGEDYVWNQQAGVLGPGEQQIAPAGELSVLPMEITGFDATRRLALNGTLTLHGWPIVHAGYDPALVAEQAALYERLVPLYRNPVVVSIEHGMITQCRPGAPTPEAAALVEVFEELFAAEPGYRTIWELGFGINTAMTTVPANCGLNEPYGAKDGVVHIGLGLTPFTRFALTFLCPATSVVDHRDNTLLGPQGQLSSGRPASRIKRTRSASCGCHAETTRSATPEVCVIDTQLVDTKGEDT